MLAKKRSAQNTISSVLLLRSEGASWQDGRTARSGALYVLRPFCPRVRGAASYLITFLYGGTSFPRLHRRRRKRLRPRRPRKECERDARSTLFAGKRHWGRVKKSTASTAESMANTIWIGNGTRQILEEKSTRNRFAKSGHSIEQTSRSPTDRSVGQTMSARSRPAAAVTIAAHTSSMDS